MNKYVTVLQNVHNGAKDFMKVDALNNLGNNLAKSKIHISILKCSSIRFPLHSIIVISFTFFMIFFSFVWKEQRLSVNVLTCILILKRVSLILQDYFLNFFVMKTIKLKKIIKVHKPS